jgi:hypothetical protein
MRAMVREWHGAEPEFTGNIATDYGTRNEAGALIEYQLETSYAVVPSGFIACSDWAGCSPDGLISLFGGVEVKCPYGKRKADSPHKSITELPHYYDQIQFSLWVTSRAWWDFYQWARGMTKLERVEPDSAWRRRNIPKLQAFWEDYLIEREKPNADKHLEPLRKVIDTPEAARMVAEYDDMTEAMERAKERRDEIRDQIIGLCSGSNSEFAGRKVTKSERAGAVAYAKVLAKYAPDVDLEPFRGKPTTVWTIK